MSNKKINIAVVLMICAIYVCFNLKIVQSIFHSRNKSICLSDTNSTEKTISDIVVIGAISNCVLTQSHFYKCDLQVSTKGKAK